MRSIIKIALSAALACGTPLVLAACGGQGGTEGAGAASTSTQAAAGEFATLGDVFSVETENIMSTFDEQRYVCAFSLDGTWWRVEAELPDGMFDELNEVWVEDQAKVQELLSPLAVKSAVAIDTPPEEELAALAGKTGADLSADGFTFSVGTLVVNGDTTDCVATKDSFEYLITFDGAVPDENTDDPASAVANMTVSSAGIQGLTWDVFEGV